MATRSLLYRLRLAPLHHHLRRPLSAATPPPDESPPPPPPPSNSKLFVAGLSWSVDERSLMDAFSSFGTVSEEDVRSRCSTKWHGGRSHLARAHHNCELFDEMPCRHLVAYSAAIYQHARDRLFDKSVGLFVGMVRAGLCPNSFTLVGVLLAAAGVGDVVLAKSVHGWAVKSRLESNPFVGTALLNCYMKCVYPMKAWAVFGEMRDPSVVTWSAMISGLVHNSLFEEALLMFKRMLYVFGPVHNVATMISVAQACADGGDLGQCESAHAYAVKDGLDLNVSVTNSILGMYLSFGNLEIGRVIFRKIVFTDVVTWTLMMGFLLEHACADEVTRVFVQMRSNGIAPDRIAMVRLVQACAHLGDVRRGKLVHNQIVTHGFSRELPAVNSLITVYSKCGDLRSARMLFDDSREKNLVSWTAMVSGYVENGSAIEGMHLFSKMRSEDKFVIDSVMVVTVLIACYEIAKSELCAQLHGYSYKSGLYMCRPVLNTFTAVYGKCGHVLFARKVFDEMISRSVISWNTMILSYGINGKGEEAVALFNEMEKSSVEGDNVTYLNTLLACSHSGLVDEGLTIYRRMINEKGIHPSQEHLGCIVDMLARAGRLEEAAKIATLTQNEMGLNAWKALMGGCHLHHDIGLTKTAAEEVFKMESLDFGHVVLLSNSYASLQNFSAAESVRSCSTKHIAKKTLGLSSIEVIPSST